MGGDIYIESELGKGSTFSVVVVFETSTVALEEKKEETLTDEQLAKLQQLKILLVEDNEFNRMVAEDTLSDLLPGVRVSMAFDGLEAVNRLKEELFDIVLMDIQMPVMDGLTATKEIRNTLTGPSQHVKIIAMTANVMQEDVKEYLATGMDEYVSKPFHPQELLAKMNEVMTNIDPVDGKAPQVTEANAVTPSSPVTNMTFISQFTGGKPEKIQKYTSMFLVNAPKMLEQLEKGLIACDHNAIKIAAHSLKPQMTYMGIKEEESGIAAIEHCADAKDSFEKISGLLTTLKSVCNRAFVELENQN
jgi:CheY-like chemotaxis protein/HPt (histidine-containing phosphotransfer) domain-containing protein